MSFGYYYLFLSTGYDLMPQLLVQSIKFIHVTLAISFYGLSLFSYIFFCGQLFARTRKQNVITTTAAYKQLDLYSQTLLFCKSIDKGMLSVLCLLILTGSLLVHPKHFTFTTPWIDAAYTLIILSALCYIISMKLRNHHFRAIQKNKYARFGHAWLYHACHLLMFMMVFFIIHDAVTKVTYL